MTKLWFDAHLDLAYLAVRGRDMLVPLADLKNQDPDPPAAVTLPALRDGGVRLALATIFTEPVDDPAATLQPEQYRAEDVEGAHRRGRAQLEVYLTWRDRGLISMNLRERLTADPNVGEVRGGMGVSEVEPPTIASRVAAALRDGPLHIGVLMENADPIRSPDELAWWVEHGVVAIGLAWARPSRYASGNATPLETRVGLTDLGREMVAEMDRLGVTHDVSHLSDRALEDLFIASSRPVIASHSNCRALIDRPGGPANQRHLTDSAIREIVRRGGVIGLNLYSSFLIRGAARDRRASIDEAVSHVERVCELAGSRRFVGLGSDMDGGFSAQRLPAGVDTPRGLHLLREELHRRGWSDEEIEDFAWRNWARFFAGEK